MSEYDDVQSLNDLDVATPIDGAPAEEVYASIRQIKSVLKNFGLVVHKPSGQLRTGEEAAVTSSGIADGAVTEPKIATNAVTKDKMADNSVGTNEIEDDAVTGSKIPDGTITTAKLNNSAVTEDKLASGAVKNGKLHTSATDAERPVVSDAIRDGAVTDAKINSVGVGKLSGGSDSELLQKVAGVWTPVTLASLGLGGADVTAAFFVDSKTSGTGGGGPAVAATWNQRDLSELVDAGNIATFAGNTFKLTTGDYMIYAVCAAYNVGKHQLRLYRTINAGGNSVEVVGMTRDSAAASDLAVMTGGFTVSDALDDYEIQHWTENANATDGFGRAGSSGELEIYTQVFVVKVD